MRLKKKIDFTIEALSVLDFKPIHETVLILKKAREKAHTVFTFGNGGSHCNASHFAQDLLKTCGIKTICISDMNSSILAFMNDDGIEYMFDGVLNQLININDILIAFSCSGNSKNAYYPLVRTNDNFKRILFTGDHGGKAKDHADVIIKIPNSNICIQESCHSVICHAIIEALLDE